MSLYQGCAWTPSATLHSPSDYDEGNPFSPEFDGSLQERQLEIELEEAGRCSECHS